MLIQSSLGSDEDENSRMNDKRTLDLDLDGLLSLVQLRLSYARVLSRVVDARVSEDELVRVRHLEGKNIFISVSLLSNRSL